MNAIVEHYLQWFVAVTAKMHAGGNLATKLRYSRHFDVLVDARQWYCAVEENQCRMALT
jgi:hypothetical protein